MKWIQFLMDRRRIISAIVWAFAIIIPLSGYQKQAFSEENALSLNDCLDIAFKHNQDIEGARLMKNEAGSKLAQAKSKRFPEVKAEASAGYISELNRIGLGDMTVDIPGLSTVTIPGREMEMGENEKADLALSLIQPIYTGGRIESGIKMAQAGFEIACHQISLEENRIRNEVTTLFYQLAKSVEYKKVTIMSRDQIERHLKDAKNMVDQGMLLQSDIYPIDIRRLDTELMIVKADNAISRAKAALSERLGFPPEKELAILVDWGLVPPWPIPENLIRKSGDRQEQRIARKQIEVASAEIDMAKGALKPEVGFMASGHYGYPGFNTTDPDWDTWWQAGVNVSFTIFDMDRKRKEREAAVIKKARFEKMKESVDHKISLDQINARLAYEESYRNMKITREKVLAAEENYRLKNDNFKVGMTTNTDFLDAHMELVKAQADQVVVSAEMRIAWSEFLRAMGEENWTAKSERGEN
ncbi:MAG: TolC family protein [Proteobacteria bacterium]|nr:TolC family protein [Pseudomonadota bacterium]